MKKKLILLYGNTGGGHRSAARAIAQAVQMAYPDLYETELVDGLSNAPFVINAFTETYPMWVNHARVLYALGFHASNNRRRIIALRNLLEPLSEKTAEAIIRDHPADLYVSCHPLFNHVVPQSLRRHRLNAHYIHVVTDLVTGHAAHYVADVDHLIVPTEESRAEAIKNLVPPEKITVTGQPIAPDFAQRVAKGVQLRRELGLDERMVVLLIGGGDGMGRLEVTARQIALSGLPLQLIVVCGRNQTVKENLEFLNPRVPMHVFGFVSNIPELMGASDVLVTKAGPGTICEAFAARLPIILYDAVPGQEEGNVGYVVNGGAGAWCPTPWTVIRQLKQWLAQPAALEQMREAAARLAKPNSSLEIAHLLHRFAQQAAGDERAANRVSD